MEEPERVTRPFASRTEPDRSWGSAFRSASGNRTGDHATSVPHGADDAGNDGKTPAYGAVNNAYRLIDEYLRQGQRMAENVWLPLQNSALPSTPFFGSPPQGEASYAPLRLLRAMGDMATVWLELVQQTLPGAIGQGPSGQAATGSAGPFAMGNVTDPRGKAANPNGTSALRVSVKSQGQVEVSVELNQAASVAELIATELRCVRQDVPPISEVKVRNEIESSPVLEVVIPSGQPAGTYNGLLLHSTSHRPCGTVSVVVE